MSSFAPGTHRQTVPGGVWGRVGRKDVQNNPHPQNTSPEGQLMLDRDVRAHPSMTVFTALLQNQTGGPELNRKKSKINRETMEAGRGGGVGEWGAEGE